MTKSFRPAYVQPAMLALATVLLTSAVPARSDELGNTRAGQDPLQRRLEELAQIPAPGSPYPGGPTAPTAGQGLVGGTFPRSWVIPGTDTSIRIGGEITEIIDYWISGGNPNSSPQSSTVGDNGQLLSIPLDTHTGGFNAARARSHHIFWQTPRQSKLSIETRTPSSWGEARTYMEFDWAGSTAFAPGGAGPTNVSDNLIPRLRFAYGTLGGILAGQANSNFSDPDANSEVIDFGGNVGDPGVVRIPQVRYTLPLDRYGFLGAFSVSAETPETEVATTNGQFSSDAGAGTTTTAATTTCTGATTTTLTCVTGTASLLQPVNPAKTTAPDLTAAWYIPQPWGHFDISSVVRPGLQFNDGQLVRRNFIGYGAHIGMEIKPGWFGWAKDSLTFHIVGGNGIGRYLNCSCNFSLDSNYGTTAPTTRAAAAAIRVNTTTEWGGNIGYAHYWLPNLRSVVSAGINHHDIDPFVGATQRGALNKELVSAHANLLWNPVPFALIGAEYMYGHRVVKSNLKGDEHVLIGKFAVRF